MKGILFSLLMVSHLVVLGEAGNYKHTLDSLLKRLGNATSEPQKIDLFSELSHAYRLINATKGVEFGKKALELAEKRDQSKEIGKAQIRISANYIELGEIDSAVLYNEAAETRLCNLSDRHGLGDVYYNYGLIYMHQGSATRTMSYFFKAIKLYQQHGNLYGVAAATENIGSAFLLQKNYKKAEHYYTLALKEFGKLKRHFDISRCLGNIGLVRTEEKVYDKALQSLYQSLEMSKRYGIKSNEQMAYVNIANVYTRQAKYQQAIKYLKLALKLGDELNYKNSIVHASGNLGITYYELYKSNDADKLLNLKRSEKYLKEAIDMAKNMKLAVPALIQYYFTLTEVYILLGNSKKAISALEDHLMFKDSIFRIEKELKMAKQEEAFKKAERAHQLEIQQNKIEIAKLENENKRSERVIFIGGVLLLTMVSLYATKNYKDQINKQKHALSEIAQMQSHDIRGPLARILGLLSIYNHEDKNDPVNEDVIKHIKTSADEIDEIIVRVINTSYLNELKAQRNAKRAERHSEKESG